MIQHAFHLFVVAGAVRVLCAGGSEATLTDKALEALAEAPPACAECFDFVVVGDTRSGEPIMLPKVFHQAIEEWNILKPAFVIDIGDLILGGAAEGLDAQWDEFERVVGLCRAPFFPVVGNHDVSDPATEAIYLERMGALTYAFDCGNSRFIVLNTEEQGAVDRVSEAQAAWLRGQLGQGDAKNIFLFLHKPYFDGDWDIMWVNVAEALRGHPVKAVFGSHWHLYRDCGVREGVRYVISGGGGAPTSTPEEEGGFFHYLWVRVRGEDVSWSVIRPGAILPEDVITKARLREIEAVQTSLYTDAVEVPYGENFDRDVTVHVRNAYPSVLSSTLTWEVPAGWHVTPQERTYTVPAEETESFTFRIKSEGPGAVRFPVPTCSTAISRAEYGKPIAARKAMDLVPVTRSPHAKGEVSIDGTLDEWAHAMPLPLSYPWEFDITNTGDLRAQVLLMWDEQHVYLAVEADDDEFYQPYAGDIVWSADNVQLFLDAWEWGLTLTEEGEEVFLYKGPGRESETVNTAVKLAVHRDGRRTVYEAAFPASEVAPLVLREGNSYGLSVVMNDLDPSVPKRPRHWAELTPGAGSSGPFPKAKVVLGGLALP